MDVQNYYDQFVGKLIRDFLVGNRRAEAAITFAARHLIRAQPQRILDLGCGIGWSTYEFSRCCRNSIVHGLDLSPQLISIAKRMFSGDGRCSFFCGDLTASDWRPDNQKKYQACVMLDVYEHIPRDARPLFHQALKAVLDEEAVIILTCPTPLHQDYLRTQNPKGLQPIDEDIHLAELARLAEDISAELVHYEYKAIWRRNDYFHAALQRNVKLVDNTGPLVQPSLLIRKERWVFVEAVRDLLSKDLLEELRRLKPSYIKRVWRALQSFLATG